MELPDRETARRILAEFDAKHAANLTFPELAAAGATREVLVQLLERGWLRAGGAPETFVRTEDGRLQLAGPRDVTIYSRPGCHLCEQAKAQIAPLLAQAGARLTEINIDADARLRERYEYDVPVIFLGARKVAKHRVDLAKFRRQLRELVALE